MEIGFLVSGGAKFRGVPGVGRRPPAQELLRRTWQLMDARLAEYAVMDAEIKAASNG